MPFILDVRYDLAWFVFAFFPLSSISIIHYFITVCHIFKLQLHAHIQTNYEWIILN